MPDASPQNRRAALRRQAILTAATDLFLEKGYEAASINDLVARLGGSKSTVYSYFDGKEKLFEAVVSEAVNEVPEMISAEALARCTLREGLLAIGERLLALVTSARHVALARIVIAEAERSPEIGRIYYRCGPGHILDILTAFLDRRAADEGYRVADTRELIEGFTGMLLHGSIFRRFCIEPEPPAPEDVRRSVEQAVNLFLAALPRSAGPAGLDQPR